MEGQFLLLSPLIGIILSCLLISIITMTERQAKAEERKRQEEERNAEREKLRGHTWFHCTYPYNVKHIQVAGLLPVSGYVWLSKDGLFYDKDIRMQLGKTHIFAVELGPRPVITVVHPYVVKVNARIPPENLTYLGEL